VIPAAQLRRAEATTQTGSRSMPPPPRVRLVRCKEGRP
jgi:hypothetical protein